ncbi:hypothetical protein N658DRAFT_315443 [Parathielavia hyrcaniae]|uniref:Secreted protein n=1 Tax=Parathielavia hyrcaniae TaxID=113614 RepID=A0AAN6PVV1_9PEZI|nr:hypothetical protein N658DRAFT_315443 [Parathielavia hyrcaniae]
MAMVSGSLAIVSLAAFLRGALGSSPGRESGVGRYPEQVWGLLLVRAALRREMHFPFHVISGGKPSIIEAMELLDL